MSLFKAREWWATQCGENGEEFDRRSMCVGNLDNDPSGAMKIAVGSFQGTLRIYQPKQKEFNVTDLLLEQELNDPILQVEAGRFLPSYGEGEQLGIAVLHPRSLTVYQLYPTQSNGQVSYYSLKQAYQHTFERTSDQFVYGPFGEVSGKDFICVQSMDGELNFFEHDKHTFSRFLPDFLVPGPLVYFDRTDSFVTYNSEMQIQNFKYKNLATSSAETHREEKNVLETESATRNAGITQGKRMQADWSLNIGEHVLEIRVGRYSRQLTSTQKEIILIGERHLWVLNDSGAIKMQKKLDYNPSCSVMYMTYEGGPYNNSVQELHNLIIGTHTSNIMIYRHTQLIWSARLQFVPVALSVCKFGNMDGLVVALDDTGSLVIHYMGTDPPTQGVGAAQRKDLNYDEMGQEHQELMKIIRDHSNDGAKEPTEKVTLRAQVPNVLDDLPNKDGTKPHNNSASDDFPRQLTVLLYVSFTGNAVIENVSVSLSVPRPFHSSEDTFIIRQIGGGRNTPIYYPIMFSSDCSCLPTTVSVPVAASYTLPTGESCTTHYSFDLPICLVLGAVPPVKNAENKLVIQANRPPPNMATLFEDVRGLDYSFDQRVANPMVTTLRFYRGPEVTVITSRSGDKYRVQSNCFEAMWLVLDVLSTRLRQLAANDGNQEPFGLTFVDALPLSEYFSLIDNHFRWRQAVGEVHKQLEERAFQYRVIQKRLLVRFKDRNPTPLAQLDEFLEDTHDQIMDLAKALEHSQGGLADASNRLSCATSLLLLVMKFRFQLDSYEYKTLRCYLTPEVVDSQAQGWEERVNGAITFMLRTLLSKTSRDATNVNQPLAMPPDTSKLKKHITMVCDRLHKGMRIKRESNK